MLARHEGQIVFVAGAIPGERVRVRVSRVSKHLAFADTVDGARCRAATGAPSTPTGPAAARIYAHVSYERQLRLKSEVIEDAFARIAKMPLPAPVSVLPSQEHGYRMRARLHVKDGRFGFFREGTHEMCDAGPTRQLLPATIDCVAEAAACVGPDARGVVRAVRKRRGNRAGGAARTGAVRNHPASCRPDRGHFRTVVRRSSIGASGRCLRVAVRHRAHRGVSRLGCR